ncbi:WXG100 family type VII secretion target [Microbacterium sp. P05]|uniref:WXG100 family type VII secretion target n=1 Tax=Microbacterium sp. P05 TaxID=3366948 RepID=UPI00374660C8
MAELGQTTDPVALVPGSPSHVYSSATTWRGGADTATATAEGIRGIASPEGWTGDAATAFAGRRDAAATAWDELAGTLRSGADAADAYAQTLGWAQQKAGDAISMWQSAQAQTLDSLNLAKMQERLAKPTDIIPPVVDAGAGLRVEAQALLAYAREEVATAGAAATDAVRAAGDIAPPPPDPWLVAGTVAGMLVEIQITQAYNSLALLVNATASLGNALIQHPETLLAILAGGGMMLGGSGMTVGGGGLTLTGAGAAPGIPLAASGIGVVGAGAALAGGGLVAAGLHGAFDSRVEVMQQRGVDRGDGRDDLGHFAPAQNSKPWVDKEAQGIKQIETEEGVTVIRDKVIARVEGGNPNGRYFDGLIKNEDGTYTAVEVKSGSAVKDQNQRTFDDIVNGGTPATATVNGEKIRIVEVILREVP